MGTYPLGLIISERHNFTLKTKTTTLTAKLKLLSQEGPLAMRCDAMRRSGIHSVGNPISGQGWGVGGTCPAPARMGDSTVHRAYLRSWASSTLPSPDFKRKSQAGFSGVGEVLLREQKRF